mmetsp:Transcript_32421/g.55068  ORF Transcript_32421/g.55068 Transcript_32421/m.55068 type:complete len:253 (+) Transcript_32421:1690-2448(+)
MTPFESMWEDWTCSKASWTSTNCTFAEEELSSNERVLSVREAQKYYEIERNNFDKHLGTFLEMFNKKLRRTPTINSRPLDLYRLYREVVHMGGCDRVVAQEGCWTKIFRTLENYSVKVTDASYRLKRYYKHYLYAYEQHFYFGKPLTSPEFEREKNNGSSMKSSNSSGRTKRSSQKKVKEFITVPTMTATFPSGFKADSMQTATTFSTPTWKRSNRINTNITSTMPGAATTRPLISKLSSAANVHSQLAAGR